MFCMDCYVSKDSWVQGVKECECLLGVWIVGLQVWILGLRCMDTCLGVRKLT